MTTIILYVKYVAHLDILRHVSLPLELALALLDHGGDVCLALHELGKGLGELDLLLGRVWGRHLDIVEVSGEHDEHVVLGDVVLDLGLQEGLQ